MMKDPFGHCVFLCVFLCNVATCGTTHWPRCWLWQTSMQAAKSWCLRPVQASCWELSWKEWEVRDVSAVCNSIVVPGDPVFISNDIMFMSLCNYCLCTSFRLWFSDSDVPRRRTCSSRCGELRLPCTFPWYTAWFSHLSRQCSAGRHSGHKPQRHKCVYFYPNAVHTNGFVS